MAMNVKITKKQPNSKMCFVCGLKNRFGLQARFYELEDNRLLGIFTPALEHQGYPGRLHGGIAATILDETIGRAIMLTLSENIWGVTVDFSMKLRKPIPLDGEVRVVATITSEDKRSFTGKGQVLLADGQVAVEAQGKYLKMDITRITDFDFEGNDWRTVSLADDLTNVEMKE
jgi:acyl-coenzyme A thioesterase PaaI-like protein